MSRGLQSSVILLMLLGCGCTTSRGSVPYAVPYSIPQQPGISGSFVPGQDLEPAPAFTLQERQR